MNNIYFFTADAIWPVCDAGAVVIAKDKQQALELVKKANLQNASEPQHIGYSKQKPKIVFSNNGDY